MSSLPLSTAQSQFQPRLAQRRFWGAVFMVICWLLSLVSLAVLVSLLVHVWNEGGSWLSLKLLTNYASVLNPREAGLKSALWGTIWLAVLTAIFSITIGIGAAVYLEEFAARNRFTRFIHLNIANLAGVPSIVYGILGLALFVRWCRYDESVLSGALTLTLLILPVIIIAAREALAAVPSSLRQAALALGATRWQTVWHHVLPAALPGIMTGIILAISRAIGETAPLIMVGAVGYIRSVPESLRSPFTALPIQIFDWTGRPQSEFHHLAAAGILVLLGVLLTMNALAAGIRAWQQRSKVQ